MPLHPVYRVGIAGAGAFAAFLTESLAPLPEFTLSAVAARTPAKRRAVVDAWLTQRQGAQPPEEYSTAEELVDRAEVDVVIIATPPDTQAELTRRALERGRHVFLEKPGALSAEALAANVHLAAARQKALVVDLVMRHSPLVEAVAQVLRGGWLGRTEQASLVNAAHRVMAHGHWFWDERRSGGIFIEHGVHFFEVARHWFGEAETIAGGRLAGDDGSHDRVFATALHRDEHGATVPVTYYHGFTRLPQVEEITRWEIICERGRIVMEGWVPQTLRIEGHVPASGVPALDTLLAAVPRHPDVDAVMHVRTAGERLRAAAETGELQPYAGTVNLPDRQGWYAALVRARWYDLCAMCQDPNRAGLITPQDAVRDLALAEAACADD